MAPAILVHGGAGVLDADRLARCRKGCEAAARQGWAVLAHGGAALDAVEAAVRALEDDGDFNAGYGSVLTRDGTIEVDAALMDGSLRAGAVGAVPWMRHPVTLARRLLDEGRHILLVGQGAVEFARQHGLSPEQPAAMITPRARARWERDRLAQLDPAPTGDTVGAVALDAQGGLAASCSTGGMSHKRPGRVGDSPIIGAGLYALDGVGAATATGHGESILRVSMCWFAVERMAHGSDAGRAAREAVAELPRRLAHLPESTRGAAGIITIDARGRLGQHRSSAVMPWAAIEDGRASSGT